jgi:hypothetical protein
MQNPKIKIRQVVSELFHSYRQTGRCEFSRRFARRKASVTILDGKGLAKKVASIRRRSRETSILQESSVTCYWQAGGF